MNQRDVKVGPKILHMMGQFKLSPLVMCRLDQRCETATRCSFLKSGLGTSIKFTKQPHAHNEFPLHNCIEMKNLAIKSGVLMKKYGVVL